MSTKIQIPHLLIASPPALYVGLSLLLALAFGMTIGLGIPAIQIAVFFASFVAMVSTWVFSRPELLFYALIGIIYLLGSFQSELLPESALYLGLGGVLVAVLVFRQLGKQVALIFDKGSLVWALLFGTWATISAILSPQFGLVRVYWLVIVLFILVPNIIKTRRQFRVFVWVIVIAALIASVVILWQALGIIRRTGFSALVLYKGIKFETELDAGGILSARLLKALPFALVLLLKKRGRGASRWLLVGIIGIGLLAILFTFSNNALVGAGMTLLLLAVFSFRNRDRFLIIILIIASIFVISFYSLDERLVDQINQILSGADYYTLGSSRGLLFSLGWQSILAAPILGHGPGQAGYILPAFLPFEYLNRAGSDFVVPHNMLLSIGVETGIPGVILFLGLYLSVIVQLWKGIRTLTPSNQEEGQDKMLGYALLIALIVYLFQGMLISIQTEKLMWILMGAGISYSLLVKKGIFWEGDEALVRMSGGELFLPPNKSFIPQQ